MRVVTTLENLCNPFQNDCYTTAVSIFVKARKTFEWPMYRRGGVVNLNTPFVQKAWLAYSASVCTASSDTE